MRIDTLRSWQSIPRAVWGRRTVDHDHRLRIIATFGLLLVAASHLSAEDIVVLKTETERSEYRMSGTVIEYDGAILVLRQPSGREERLPASRIVSVLGDWKPKQREADELFATGEFQVAAQRYREALAEEDRRWVRRRVLAQLVWCYRAVEQFDEAFQAFSALYRDDPQTPYFATIPLAWNTGQPDPALERRAMAALQDKAAAARLLGASWLITSSHRAEALDVLQQLAGDSDARIVWLAEAQLWRTQLATVQAAEVQQWQVRLTKMPTTIRCGPLFILGQAWARVNRHEDAALTLLQAAILHPDARDVVPQALLAAARELEQLHETDAAVTLYREIVAEQPTSPTVAQAQQRLQSLIPIP